MHDDYQAAGPAGVTATRARALRRSRMRLMNTRRRVLIVDDSSDDAILVVLALKREGYDPDFERVTTAEAMRAALAEREWDVVLSDYTVPAFGALPALALLHELELDLPFIIMSGTIDETMAVDALRAGAHDFVLKGKLARLAPAIARQMRGADVGPAPRP